MLKLIILLITFAMMAAGIIMMIGSPGHSANFAAGIFLSVSGTYLFISILRS